MLGLGLGINKSNRVQTSLELLLKYTSAMWLPLKATGTSEGINSPFTNPPIDLKGVVGKNLFDPSQNKLEGRLNADGSFFSTTSSFYSIATTDVLPNSIYVWSGDKFEATGGIAADVYFWDVNKIFISRISKVDNLDWVFTTPSNCKYVSYRMSKSKWNNPQQLELGSVATAYEPYGKANLLLQGFAGTTSSGYVGVLCPNGKTVSFLKFDAINDLGIANHPSLDITGTSDFGFGKVISVPSLATHYPFTKAESSEATTQYGLKITNTGILSIILEGTTIQLATGLVITTLYAMWVERISGVLKCFINGVEVFSVANVTSLTSRPNFRVGALSTNVGGTTHTGFSNANMGTLVVVKTDVLKARSAYFKFTLKTFGV